MTTNLPEYDSLPSYDAKRPGELKQTPRNTSEPGYIYYRLYAPDGSIPSKSPADPQKPFIGRIPAISIPPPHNVTSLKRFIVDAEGLSDPDGTRTALYLSPGAFTAMDPTTRVPLLGTSPFPGSTPETAYALVRLEELTSKEKAEMDSLGASPSDGEATQYLYYQLFTRNGQDVAKTSFAPGELAKGRIDKMQVAPPYTAQSIKRCIAKNEDKPIYASAELYEGISALRATSDEAYIPLFQGDTPGRRDDKPLVLVQPERRRGLHNRPFKVLN
ncbi:hypothetical protein C8R43DRAFT_963401 [Mycena crocata]|nr:hypothetical protein C8R43DRAFT_963401 [Mycena crocata]